MADMADTEETSAQRQARIRREKREAKIKGGGQERLDKITQLSGRTPETMKHYDSPIPTPPRSATPAALTPPPITAGTNDPEQLRQQEEFIRAMLRNQAPQQQQGQQQQGPLQGQEPDDPMMKMLSQMLGSMNNDPNAMNAGLPSLNPDDIAKATGLPPFVANMMMGNQQAPPTAAQLKTTQLWKLLHIICTTIAGIYMLITVNRLTGTFGDNPPAPATFKNPFVIFVTFELLLYGVKSVLSTPPSKGGLKFWWQLVKEIGRDGALMVFLMGVYSWWHGLA